MVAGRRMTRLWSNVTVGRVTCIALQLAEIALVVPDPLGQARRGANRCAAASESRRAASSLGSVAISFLIRGIPMCSIASLVSSEEMISAARRPGGEVRLVALVVVRVEVRIHHVAHRLGRHFPDQRDEVLGRGRAGVGIHHQHAVIQQDDDGVAVGADREELGLGVGEVDVGRDGAQVEQLLRRARTRREPARAPAPTAEAEARIGAMATPRACRR